MTEQTLRTRAEYIAGMRQCLRHARKQIRPDIGAKTQADLDIEFPGALKGSEAPQVVMEGVQ